MVYLQVALRYGEGGPVHATAGQCVVVTRGILHLPDMFIVLFLIL